MREHLSVTAAVDSDAFPPRVDDINPALPTMRNIVPIV